MSGVTQLDYEDHWQEKEINLERTTIDDQLLGFTISGGVDVPLLGHQFTFIIVTHITGSSLVHRDGQLKLYDIILRANNVDFTNIKHEAAVNTLRTSGKKVRLLIRRLSPLWSEEIELEHNGKLNIFIGGGIDNEYIRGDHGIFLTDIGEQQNNKQLNIGDRLLQISSTCNTYDLRFATRKIAKKRIRLACAESRKIKLYVKHRRPLALGDKRSDLDQDPCVAVDSENDDHDIQLGHRSNNREVHEEKLILSFDSDDYQRYENRGKVVKRRLLNDRSTTSSTVQKQEPHLNRHTVESTMVDSDCDQKVNTTAKELDDAAQNSGFKIQDYHRSAARQRKLNEAAIREAHAEKLRREESKATQRARLNREGGRCSTDGRLKWQVD